MYVSRLCLVLVMSSLCGMVLAQTFQYSRGWTNGKKRSQSTHETACQFLKLKAILEARNIPQMYWQYCDWQNLVLPYDMDLRPHSVHTPAVVGPPPSNVVTEEDN